MQAKEIDFVDEILGTATAAEWVAPAPVEAMPTAVVDAPVSIAPKRRLRLRFRNPLAGARFRNPLAGARFRPRHVPRAVGFALAFAVGAIACLAVLAAVAVAAFSATSGRVVPGVRLGSLDLSGLSRDQVIARLNVTYAYLGQGEVTVTTPTGAATITYQQLGRGPDVAFMADETMRIGHSGNPIGDAINMLKTAVNGQTVPVVVHIDPTAVATSVHQLVGNDQLPRDAQAWMQTGTFTYSSSAPGRGIDEAAIFTAIIDHLTDPGASASFQAGGAFVELKPRVNDKDAEAAISEAQKMLVDVNLIFGVEPGAGGSGQTASPARIYKIDAQTVFSWIDFGTRSDGTYGPFADPARMQVYLSDLSKQIQIAPVEPTIVFSSAGAPVGVKGGSDGASIDRAATSQALATYLDGLASGEQQVFAVAATATSISPNITVASLSHLVDIGSWTTTFYPDISNGNGANIRVPAQVFNGQIVAPGQQFSFLDAVGPIDPAHGFTWGGVIQGGKSNHTGAMGGGICSASTTMFNAAARAGLQIDERHAHFYYIDRYPVGLDATVFSDGAQTWDLKWTNDTPNPILIVGSSTYGSKSTVTIELWSLPTGRTVAFSPEFKANMVWAGDSTEYVGTLAPGQQVRAEFPTDGFDTSRTRTVTDSTGKVVHTDQWFSHYTVVDGLLEIGASIPSAPMPPPDAPSPAPAIPAPAPASTPAGRLRSIR